MLAVLFRTAVVAFLPLAVGALLGGIWAIKTIEGLVSPGTAIPKGR
jgi:hypothetical protein